MGMARKFINIECKGAFLNKRIESIERKNTCGNKTNFKETSSEDGVALRSPQTGVWKPNKSNLAGCECASLERFPHPTPTQGHTRNFDDN